MAQVRLRIAGLYFNEIVDMPGAGPWTVRQVMDEYVRLNPIVVDSSPASGAPARLSYDVQQEAGGDAADDSILAITVQHGPRADGTKVIGFKFYDYNTKTEQFTLEPSNGNTLGNKRRRSGVYRLQETPLDGGAVIVAWQYYVQSDGGSGPQTSATQPGEGFQPFGSAQAKVKAGDVVTWRMVAIRRGPLDDMEAPETASV